MANTLTNLIPDIYAALDVVSRELVGFIPAVARDSSADRVAANQTLRIPYSPANAAGGNITPAMTLPSAADQTIANKTLTISKQRFFPFSWSGEEKMAVNAGAGYLTLQQNQIAQALRAAVNEIEVDLAVAAAVGASRAYGTTAGTAPVLADWAGAKKILDDNGAPISDRCTVINTTAGVSLRSTANLYKVNEAGDNGLLRNGTLGNLYGFDIRESAQIQTPTAGAMASATSTSAAFTVGQTVIPLATAGTGVVAAGDIVTFANDTNKYMVASVSFAGANPAAGDSITLAAPGLRLAQGVATRAITVFGTSARNCAFTRNAILLATRLPALDANGDLASDRMTITDPNSGLSFELAVYPGFRMNVYHVSICWGVSVIKPEHLAIIIG
ncbi:MAG TPA: P22 coat - protein 5 family protein [Candidatus Competibacteraceae bacterium]|nr:P22 coat - protein 5 family protein [Candidatus Competibacteraceae bacterium]